MTEDHRSDDVAAAGVEKDDAPQFRVRAARLEKIDKGLWRLSLDYAVSHDDVGTMAAALVGFKRRDAETHRGAVALGRSRRNHGSDEGERGKTQRPKNGGQ
jgi:hypothetical protein